MFSLVVYVLVVCLSDSRLDGIFFFGNKPFFGLISVCVLFNK